MEFKSTENLLKSQERQAPENLPKNVKLVRTQTFDISSSSSTHSKQGRKIVVENVQVHQLPAPVPRNRSAFKSQPVLKTAKDNANEIIQMSTFSTSVDEPDEIAPAEPVIDTKTSKKSYGMELEDFSDISSISSHHGNKRRVKSQVKVDEKVLKKPVELKKDTDEGDFIVHKSGIWGDVPIVAVEEPAHKLSEYEKENDESIKEKSSEVKVVSEKPPVKPGKLALKSDQDRPRTSKSKAKPKVPTIKSESSQTLYRSSVTSTNSSSEGESSVSAKPHKKHRKDRSKGSSRSSETTSYSSATNSKSKSSKGSSVDEPLVEPDEVSDRSDQILGVYVHDTTDLKFDIRIRDPRVRVTIVDERTGGLAIYNQQTIKAKQMEQPFILPLTTKQCDFISKIAIRCKWEELLCFNEFLSHPDYKHVMLFFEILDYHNIGDSDDPDGFYEISWAFLKPFRDDAPFHFNKRLKLQLYTYQKLTKRMKLNEHVPVFNQWSIKHKKYPAILEVTVKEITPMEVGSKTNSQERDTEKISDKISKDLEHLKDTLLGKAFQVPKKIVYKKRLTRKGSLVACFSSSGHYLAYTEVVDTSQHNIMILSVPDFTVCHVLRGHSGLIHDLEWINSTYLISASADQTAILWSVDNGIGALLKIMPHSSFVYAARCLLVERHSLVIVTGGRDSLIRVWKCNEKRSGADIFQELEGHDDYVTCLVCTKQRTLLSADASGVIIEWRYEHKSLRKERTIEVEKFRGQLITDMILHSNECKVFVQVESAWEIFVLGLPSGVLIQKLDVKERAGTVHQRLGISSCGTFLFCPNGAYLVVYNLLTDRMEVELRVPYVHIGKSFISGSCVTLRHQTLAISVYGEGGGLVVYGSESHVSDMGSMNLDGLIKSTQNWELHERTEVGAHLKEMIQKIDDVFLGGNKSQMKGITKSMPELREVTEDSDEDSTQTSEDSDGLEEALQQEASDSQESIRTGTFTVDRGPEKAKKTQGKSVQIHDPNRTFSISERKKPTPIQRSNGKQPEPAPRDRTYSIESKNERSQEDDTTISESFH